MRVCQDEDGLAAVLGHEIAHVVARHPAERMSNNILTVGLVYIISALFDISGYLPSLLLKLMYSLPNSRTQEVCSVYPLMVDFVADFIRFFIAGGGRQYWTE